MTHVLTLIGNPSQNTVSDELVEVIKKIVDSKMEHIWLEEERACDIFFDMPETTETKTIRAHLMADANIENYDICIQKNDTRRKKLLIADMDSTIIQQECIDEIGNVLGLKEKIAEITERAMRGELEFESALIERVSLLKGVTRSQLETVLDTAIELTPGAKSLVQTMNKNGAKTALISGGFTFFTNRVAALVGFQHNQANELIFEGDALSGDVGIPILGKSAKKKALITMRQECNIMPQETLAVGDGANDLAMIEEAGLGVAFHAKPKVAEAADAQVNVNDLSALLFYQGYKRDEFVD